MTTETFQDMFKKYPTLQPMFVEEEYHFFLPGLPGLVFNTAQEALDHQTPMSQDEQTGLYRWLVESAESKAVKFLEQMSVCASQIHLLADFEEFSPNGVRVLLSGYDKFSPSEENQEKLKYWLKQRRQAYLAASQYRKEYNQNA